MLLLNASRINSERFAQYVAELRELSAAHHLPCGSPEHLLILLNYLNHSAAFRGECTSMLRSVFYREHGHAPTEDLLILMVVAWGGQPSAPPSPTLQATITDLLRFTAGVMRSPVAPPELAENSLEDDSPALDPPSSDPPSSDPPPPDGPSPDPPPDPSPDPPPSQSPLPNTTAPQIITAELPAAVPALLPPLSQAHAHAHSAAIEEIESAIQLLAIRSPDVKRYLRLLKDRERQFRTEQHRIAERHTELQTERQTERQTEQRADQFPAQRPGQPDDASPQSASSQYASSQSASPQSAGSLPVWKPANPLPTATAPAASPSAPLPPREDPWDPNSEFQIELRRFAAQREAERQAHHAAWQARHQHRAASTKIAEAAESAWNHLLGRRREP